MTRPDEVSRRRSFNELVAQGVYSHGFDHPAALKQFVRSVLDVHGPHRTDGAPLRVLDCGCGTGVWLEFLAEEMERSGRTVECHGFDLSDGMVELARSTLTQRHGVARIQRGDLLSEASYRFPGDVDRFDLIFAFDVVQQLPRNHQLAACALMATRLTEGGVALVFDHDRNSPYGLSMGWKKFVTRYLRVPLLPRFYCDARYPPLGEFAAALEARSDLAVTLVADAATPKMALVMRTSKED